ncbi:MAG: hypothetical protein ACMUIU_00855 [bacterium]
MKKVFYLAFAVLILSVMCFNVMPARAEVTFNGEWRVRGFAYDINGENDAVGNRSDTASFWDQRFRLYITAKVSDNLKGIVRMLAPNHVPCDYDTGGGNRWGYYDPKPVLWDVAYLDFDIPLPAAPVNVKLGRQGIDLGNYVLLGSCRTYDSVILSTAIQNVNISFLTVKLDEGQNPTYPADPNYAGFDDEDLYGAVLSFDPAPNINLGIWTVFGKDGGTRSGYISQTLQSVIDPDDYPSADAFWLGAATKMDFAPIKVNLEFDYSKVSLNSDDTVTNPDIDVTGYAFFGDICADLPAVKFGGNLLYTTGDDKTDSDYDSDLFVPISSYFSERNDYDYMVLREYIPKYYGNGAFKGDHSIGNLIAIKLYAMKDLAPKVNGMISVQNYSFTQDPDGNGGDGKNIGTEIDVRLVYKLYDNLTLTGVGAYWVTDEDIFGADNENNWLLKQEILYKF